jgi:hypothetical protein
MASTAVEQAGGGGCEVDVVDDVATIELVVLDAGAADGEVHAPSASAATATSGIKIAGCRLRGDLSIRDTVAV